MNYTVFQRIPAGQESDYSGPTCLCLFVCLSVSVCDKDMSCRSKRPEICNLPTLVLSAETSCVNHHTLADIFQETQYRENQCESYIWVGNQWNYSFGKKILLFLSLAFFELLHLKHRVPLFQQMHYLRKLRTVSHLELRLCNSQTMISKFLFKIYPDSCIPWLQHKRDCTWIESIFKIYLRLILSFEENDRMPNKIQSHT